MSVRAGLVRAHIGEGLAVGSSPADDATERQQVAEAQQELSDMRGALQRPITPKRPRTEVAAAAYVFPYYAGYSYEWAVGQILSMASPGAVVLDPWNGAGTSTMAAASTGMRPLGIDLNPAVNVVARARLVSPERGAVVSPPPLRPRRKRGDPDPLNVWFADETTCRIRSWTALAHELPAGQRDVLLVAMFLTVRALSKPFEGSNPTWVRESKSESDRLGHEDFEIDNEVVANQKRVLDLLVDGRRRSATILQASAAALPLANSTADAIIGSPPYLTRIDYGVAYSRELAVLGIDARRSRLRSALMGTTKIRAQAEQCGKDLPTQYSDILKSISDHESKDSAGYYLKQARQYFEDLLQSLDEVTRVTRPGGTASIVVQDSYYKDVHIPLGDLIATYLDSRGWDPERLERYPVPRLLTTLNRAAMEYRKGRISEWVVTMKRRRP